MYLSRSIYISISLSKRTISNVYISLSMYIHTPRTRDGIGYLFSLGMGELLVQSAQRQNFLHPRRQREREGKRAGTRGKHGKGKASWLKLKVGTKGCVDTLWTHTHTLLESEFLSKIHTFGGKCPWDFCARQEWTWRTAWRTGPGADPSSGEYKFAQNVGFFFFRRPRSTWFLS